MAASSGVWDAPDQGSLGRASVGIAVGAAGAPAEGAAGDPGVFLLETGRGVRAGAIASSVRKLQVLSIAAAGRDQEEHPQGQGD